MLRIHTNLSVQDVFRISRKSTNTTHHKVLQNSLYGAKFSLVLQEGLIFLHCYLFFSRESNREVDAEIDAFLGSKSPKKPVDPLSYIKVC